MKRTEHLSCRQCRVESHLNFVLPINPNPDRHFSILARMRRSARGSDSPLHHCAYAGCDKRRGGCRLILTNCIRHGAASQNRAAHPDFRGYLAGLVAHASALNAARGAKLHALFAWDGCRFGT